MIAELAAKHQRLLDLAADGRVDGRILALCRGRIATMLGCGTHAAASPPWNDLSPGEQACLDFTERFVLDPHGIDDDLAARVRDHLGDPGFVAFACALALFDGQCRNERMFSER